jgi:hypothetical protein
MECVSAKMVVSRSKSPSFYFSTDLLLLTAMRYFFYYRNVAFGVGFGQHPQTKVRSTPLQP